MLTIRKRLIHKKSYRFSGAAVMVCVSVITSVNMQTTIRPDRLNAIVHHTVDTKTDDKQQTTMSTVDKPQTTTATRNNQTSSSVTKNTQTQLTPDPVITPLPSDTPTPAPTPDPTPLPDPTPAPVDPPVAP
ncbi:MAG: hypothetical protein QG549_662 [Patescibacteria group bacterium]|nr:hypothetical protein [Patescibacteria group bacterium]